MIFAIVNFPWLSGDVPIVNFPWLSGDVPRLPSYGIYISQLVRFARCCTSVFDLKIFKSLQNYWHRVTDITSFGKRLESSLGHTQNFCPNLVQYILVKTSNRTIYKREYNGILGVLVSEPYCFRTNTHNIMNWCDFDMQSVINSVRQVCSALYQLPVLQLNS